MITLDYFIDSVLVALTIVVVLDSLLYELFVDWLLRGASWGTKKYAYCTLCAGFWAGLIYFGLFQYYTETPIPFWKGTFLVSGIAYTIKGLWLRLWGSAE